MLGRDLNGAEKKNIVQLPSFPYAIILLSHPAATIDEPQHKAYGGQGCLQS